MFARGNVKLEGKDVKQKATDEKLRAGVVKCDQGDAKV